MLPCYLAMPEVLSLCDLFVREKVLLLCFSEKLTFSLPQSHIFYRKVGVQQWVASSSELQKWAERALQLRARNQWLDSDFVFLDTQGNNIFSKKPWLPFFHSWMMENLDLLASVCENADPIPAILPLPPVPPMPIADLDPPASTVGFSAVSWSRPQSVEWSAFVFTDLCSFCWSMAVTN